jgi:hypothetical protein
MFTGLPKQIANFIKVLSNHTSEIAASTPNTLLLKNLLERKPEITRIAFALVYQYLKRQMKVQTQACGLEDYVST